MSGVPCVSYGGVDVCMVDFSVSHDWQTSGVSQISMCICLLDIG